MSVVQTSKIPILTYHSIDESDSVISTGRETFRRQMKFLREAEYNVVSLKKLAEGLNENVKFSSKTIVLTFDDGFRNFYIEAFPILAECDFTATVFLVTEYCEKYNDWDGSLPTIERSQLLSWKEIKELHNHGIEFGAHTRTHPNLTRLAVEEIEREIAESKAVIEERLGTETATFAYPYGIFNEQVKQIAKNYFKAAVSTNLGMVKAGNDIYALKRLDTFYLKDERIFSSLSTGKFEFYMQFRQILRGLKAKIYHH